MPTLLTTILVLTLYAGEPQDFKRVSHGVGQVYAAIVGIDGRVDYSLLKRRADLQQKLAAYAQFIADLDPASLEDPALKIAVFANAYNVFTLIGVNQAYPVTSVRKIRPLFGFFTKGEWSVGGQAFSLNDLEKKLLRPLDPRIHFVINCASASCPKLLPEVFTADNMERLMEQAVRAFLDDTGKNRFGDDGHWYLSKIFDWYKDDWGGKQGVVAFIQRYRPDLQPPKKVLYLDYDWDLNGTAGAAP